jgi:hypothetical protein
MPVLSYEEKKWHICYPSSIVENSQEFQHRISTRSNIQEGQVIFGHLIQLLTRNAQVLPPRSPRGHNIMPLADGKIQAVL